MDIKTEIKYLFDYDVTKIKQHLESVENQSWQFNPLRQNTYDENDRTLRVHKNTESIILVWATEVQKHTVSKELFDSVFLAAHEIRRYYGNSARIGTLVLAKLFGKSEIYPHRDTGMVARIHRCHLPIITNTGCEFTINKKKFFLEEGKVIEFNNTMEHAVVNASEADRIHLICDVV